MRRNPESGDTLTETSMLIHTWVRGPCDYRFSWPPGLVFESGGDVQGFVTLSGTGWSYVPLVSETLGVQEFVLTEYTWTTSVQTGSVVPVSNCIRMCGCAILQPSFLRKENRV